MNLEISYKSFLITLFLSIVLLFLRKFGIINITVFLCFSPIWLTYSMMFVFAAFYVIAEIFSGEFDAFNKR